MLRIRLPVRPATLRRPETKPAVWQSLSKHARLTTPKHARREGMLSLSVKREPFCPPVQQPMQQMGAQPGAGQVGRGMSPWSGSQI